MSSIGKTWIRVAKGTSCCGAIVTQSPRRTRKFVLTTLLNLIELSSQSGSDKTIQIVSLPLLPIKYKLKRKGYKSI